MGQNLLEAHVGTNSNKPGTPFHTRSFRMVTPPCPCRHSAATSTPGYITPEELAALQQGPPDEPALADYTSPQAIRLHLFIALIADIAPYLGPVRAILLFYGCRRRPGDVAHFCEQRVASVALQNIKLAVCVVDIVHGAPHDIPEVPRGSGSP